MHPFSSLCYDPSENRTQPTSFGGTCSANCSTYPVNCATSQGIYYSSEKISFLHVSRNSCISAALQLKNEIAVFIESIQKFVSNATIKAIFVLIFLSNLK